MTPGVYNLDQTIEVTWPDTVVLGLGFPTLIPSRGIVSMRVASVAGVKLSGMIFDAGSVNSPVLLQVGDCGGPGSRLRRARPGRLDVEPDDRRLRGFPGDP